MRTRTRVLLWLSDARLWVCLIGLASLLYGDRVTAGVDAMQGWLAETFTQLVRRWFGVIL